MTLGLSLAASAPYCLGYEQSSRQRWM